MEPTSKMSRRERKMLRRTQAILDAARTLFIAKSYDSVTMDDIAEEADMSRATLYNHFDSKESIYFQIGIRYLVDFRERQMKIITSVTSGLEQIITLSEDLLKSLFEDPIIREIWRRFQSLLDKEFLTLDNTMNKISFPKDLELLSNDVHARYYGEIRDLEKIWFDAINRGFEDGSIKKRIDGDRLTHFLHLIFLGIVDSVNSSRALLISVNLTVEDIIRFTVDLTRNYLATV
jgi:TetR/AcrR family transcriptional regulator